MRFIKRFMLMLAFLLFFGTVKTQSILDSELKWVMTNNCIPQNSCLRVYQKLEIDPIISTNKVASFQNVLYEIIDELKLNISCVLKLKLLIFSNGEVCLDRIGMNKGNLNTSQAEQLKSEFKNLGQATPGSHKGTIQNSYGILYLTIENGQLAKFRNVNFSAK